MQDGKLFNRFHEIIMRLAKQEHFIIWVQKVGYLLVANGIAVESATTENCDVLDSAGVSELVAIGYLVCPQRPLMQQFGGRYICKYVLTDKGLNYISKQGR